jgi:site-specific DNA-methyltransferase (cytosine-N4-specific)
VSAEWTLLEGQAVDRLRELPAEAAQCCITSPPYFGLRDYDCEGQIGLEETPELYVASLVGVFREVKRVLRDDGTLWLIVGDSYAAQGGPQVDGTKQTTGSQVGAWGGQSRTAPRGVKPKDLLGIPWMIAFALRADGWYLRMGDVWHKPNVKPESVKDRTTREHEYVFMFAKSQLYYYNNDAIRGESKDGSADGRNKRSVWSVPTVPYPGAHFATFPPKLIEPMVLAGCPAVGLVLDPFVGSGTTLQVAVERGRNAVGIELNPEYVGLARRRLAGVTSPLFAEESQR